MCNLLARANAVHAVLLNIQFYFRREFLREVPSNKISDIPVWTAFLKKLFHFFYTKPPEPFTNATDQFFTSDAMFSRQIATITAFHFMYINVSKNSSFFAKKKQYHKVSANNLLKLSNIADSLSKLWQNSSIFLKIQHFFSKLFNMAKFSIFFFFESVGGYSSYWESGTSSLYVGISKQVLTC